ncbi:hypothetical protein ElyMa_007061800 [Elysia marginata]|uniref:CUE domain-containing protein n=1 Tax=Elysia marginata TaxID=1093978 RepID=A0AAV4JYA4_9GAST|nr:hypothetical protein ElyMa_007061800 [Elysia marginata]
MRSLNHDPVTLFRALFLNQLPPDVLRILAQTPDADLDTLAKTADGIMDVEFAAAATRSVQNTYPIEVTQEEQAKAESRLALISQVNEAYQADMRKPVCAVISTCGTVPADPSDVTA